MDALRGLSQGIQRGVAEYRPPGVLRGGGDVEEWQEAELSMDAPPITSFFLPLNV